MTASIRKYLSLVKFSHTIFALPFALTAYVYALVSTGTPFRWELLVEILLCMVFARNTAMGFNRWADRDIDAANPRTASREIPAGTVSSGAAIFFVIINAVLFIVTAGFINKLTLLLSPVALAVITFYSYSKRFTSAAHLILGLSLSIAPAGAYIAVTGNLCDPVPYLLAFTVLTWAAGFDIPYALQDAGFDRDNGLYSIPSRFTEKTSLEISMGLHFLTAVSAVVTGLIYGAGVVYFTGTVLFIGLLIFQHLFFTPSKRYRVGAWFGMLNGISSIVYAVFTITDLLIRQS